MWSATRDRHRWACFLLAAVSVEVRVGLNVFKVLPEGSPLPELPIARSVNGALHASLEIGAVRLVGQDLDVTTRAFNGSVPGPVLAVRPGDKLSIFLANHLGNPWGGTDADNSFHHPNNTNIHLHGLHIPEVPPGDDVLGTLIRPGSSYQYEYRVLPQQSPGTYWVHPHHHGSTTLQAGAGAAAALLVLDPPGFLSSQLEAMTETLVVLQDLPGAKLQAAADAADDRLFHVNRWGEAYGSDLLLANGAVRPVISIRPGEWRRLRLVMAGVSSWLNLDFGACEVVLLAKDGIYIEDFPRPIRRATLPPGGRADLVVKCPANEATSEHPVASVPLDDGREPGIWVDDSGKSKGILFVLRIEGPQADGAGTGELRPWTPPARTGTYLEDLSSGRAPPCSCSTILGYKEVHNLTGVGKGDWINGHLFDGPAHYLHRYPADAAVERHIIGLSEHIYHQHSYPFQLASAPAGNDPYFKAGDWHDTYMNPNAPDAVVRFHTADFSGPLLVHCHILSHSDKGMMAVEFVGGEAGSSDSCECDPVNLPVEDAKAKHTANSHSWPSLLAPLAPVCVVALVGMLFVSAWSVLRRRISKGKCCGREYRAMPDEPSVAA
eukprot:gnl/TRDRNA2_/TRDRNA2_35059_c0_seq1.p1 gnl/TRDRNA2_/TRDRNA2_35059_c0~~gnl/TRDRNA2_/TRDRNA2_35059_c0_seq1.p1  ORF type:complete len:606 (+),score=57.54 gnl/TRDRNA2_/TRDRNA2_35059_c0_seq1:51-1868(+)